MLILLANLFISCLLFTEPPASAVLKTAPEAEGFGISLAFSSTRVAIGAEHAAHVYADVGDDWKLEGTLAIESDDRCSHYFLAIDEDVCLIGSPFESDGRGAVYVFNRGEDGIWKQTQRIAAPSDVAAGGSFGFDMEVRGNEALIGTVSVHNNASPLYLYRREHGVWKFASSYHDRVASFGLSNGQMFTANQAGSRGVRISSTNPGTRAGDAQAQSVVVLDDRSVGSLDVDGAQAVIVGELPNTRMVVAFLSSNDGASWQTVTNLELQPEEESPIVFGKLRSNRAIVVSSLRRLTILNNDPHGQWTRTKALPATQHMVYRPSAIGLTDSWLVVSLEPNEGDTSLPVLFVPLSNIELLSDFLWGRLSTGELVGRLAREEIGEQLKRIALERRVARQSDDAQNKARLAMDFELLMSRYRYVESR